MFRDDSLRSLFTANEFDALLAQVRTDVLDRLGDLISEWSSNCGESDPDSYFDEFETMLKDVGEMFEKDEIVTARVQTGLKKIKESIERLNEDREPDNRARVETPTGRVSAHEVGIQAIFDDVDQ